MGEAIKDTIYINENFLIFTIENFKETSVMFYNPHDGLHDIAFMVVCDLNNKIIKTYVFPCGSKKFKEYDALKAKLDTDIDNTIRKIEKKHEALYIFADESANVPAEPIGKIDNVVLYLADTMQFVLTIIKKILAIREQLNDDNLRLKLSWMDTYIQKKLLSKITETKDEN